MISTPFFFGRYPPPPPQCIGSVSRLHATSTNQSEVLSAHPSRYMVFIKTHKTGSSTIASIFHRYGYLNNLTFLVPQCNHILNTNYPPGVCDLEGTFTNWSHSGGRYNILANHARYDRSKMDGIFHGAVYKYITILREPVAQFESMFYYFEMFKYMPAGNATLEAFFEDPVKNFERMRKRNKMYTEMRMHNELSFDLGVGVTETNSRETQEAKVKQFGREFDIVMLNEYFDESLLLLKKLLGWRLDDIRYISRGIRSSDYRYPRRMDDELRAKIRAWNSLDMQMYEFFNRTFWKKVAEYGPDFERDLAVFRKKQRELNSTCIASVTSRHAHDQRTIAKKVRSDAPKWCYYFTRSDLAFTALIRERMIPEGVPLYVNSKRHDTRHGHTSKDKNEPSFSCQKETWTKAKQNSSQGVYQPRRWQNWKGKNPCEIYMLGATFKRITAYASK